MNNDVLKRIKNYFLMSSIIIATLIFMNENMYNSNKIVISIIYEIFISCYSLFYIIKPLYDLSSVKKNMDTKNVYVYKSLFLIYLIVKVLYLLLFDFTNNYDLIFLDLFMASILALIIVPCIKLFNLLINNEASNQIISDDEINTNGKCPKCGAILRSNLNFCVGCGFKIGEFNEGINNKIVDSSSFDDMFYNSDNELIEKFIIKEMEKAEIDINTNLMPSDILKRKNILNFIFSILLFIYVCLVFFHFPIYTYLIGFIILFVFYKITKNYNLMKYLKKEVKARPGEKISNIVMSAKNSFVIDDFKIVRFVSAFLAIIIPVIIFIKPRVMYERVDGGYAVRFYTFGVTNFTSVTIPETYRGNQVVSLRGNAFSNMPFLKKASLPDTITEIRGQAFKNDISLVEVNIPKNLKYLGGGSFYNCRSIKSISLPDTLTRMGGEVFYKATSLEYVKLPINLIEIRGNSFEYCISLKKIEIPDNVVRIGGHAFYGDDKLEEVLISENSLLTRIGSSAFRRCVNLTSITLPMGVNIDDRAFKESPTRISYYYSNSNSDFESKGWGYYEQ